MEQHLLPIQSPAYILRYGGGHVDSLKKVYQKGANINELFPPVRSC